MLPKLSLPNVRLMLVYRPRRWPNINLTLDERPVFAGYIMYVLAMMYSLWIIVMYVCHSINLYPADHDYCRF